jgi:hypothetical protein
LTDFRVFQFVEHIRDSFRTITLKIETFQKKSREQVSSSLVKFRQVSSSLVKSRQVSSSLVKSCQVSSSLVKSCQVSSSLVMSRQGSSSLVESRQVLLLLVVYLRVHKYINANIWPNIVLQFFFGCADIRFQLHVSSCLVKSRQIWSSHLFPVLPSLFPDHCVNIKVLAGDVSTKIIAVLFNHVS